MDNLGGWTVRPEEFATRNERWSKLGARSKDIPPMAHVECRRQGWEVLHFNRSVLDRPLTLGEQSYERGFGAHADSEIVIAGPGPLASFRAVVGVDRNPDTVTGGCRVRFAVAANGRKVWESPALTWRDGGHPVEVALPAGCTEITLTAEADVIRLAHVNWCDPVLTAQNGAEVPCGVREAADDLLPVSFRYGGVSSEVLLPQWGFAIATERHGRFSRRVITSRNPADGFTVEFTLDEYDALPVSLWRVAFFNGGRARSQRLSEVRTIDLGCPKSSVRYSRGEQNVPGETWNERFAECFRLLRADGSQALELNAGGGRASSNYMPYFNLFDGESGVVLAIGWTGQWRAAIRPDYGRTQVKAGMEFMDCVLEPGERISQPSSLLIDYADGGFERGQNLLRRFLMTEWIPESMRRMALSFPTWGGMDCAGHLERIAMIEREKLGYECYWIDAGWFGNTPEKNYDEFGPYWGSNVGNWQVNPHLYPDGFRPISDAAAAAGMKFMLWVEPERACPGTAVMREHPEYFYDAGASQPVLNLGMPEAEKWMLDLISNLIVEQGVHWYRQDFNTDPLEQWRAYDAPDRIGMSEIRHIEGLYRIYDALLERFPGIVLDNCSSGGRRLDLEMMNRSIPFWASDLQCSPEYGVELSQAELAGLNCWLPVFGIGTQHRAGDTYNFRSALSSGVAFHMFMYEYKPVTADYPYDWHRRMLADFARVRDCMTGDYYLLTAQNDDQTQWQAMRFDRPDLGEGVVTVARREHCPYNRGEFRLEGLDRAAEYAVEDLDAPGEIRTYSGAELADAGLTAELPQRRSAKLYVYRKK